MKKYDDLQEYLIKNQSTWLITGVAGFIGSNLLEKLLILGQQVVGLDNFDTGFQHNIDQAIEDASNSVGKNLKGNFKFINGDIRELKDCKEACCGIDYVLHQAALGSVPRSIKDPINTNRTNIDGFLNMLVASKDEKIRRFIYASSSSVYGDYSDLPKFEDKTGNPLSPYAITKVVNELYANVFAKSYDLEVIGLRYFNVFGKRQDPDNSYAAVIPKWIVSILAGEDVFINGDGETSRDFCYVNNAVQINLLAALTNNNAAINQVYNVAVNDRTSLNELYKMIDGRITLKTKILKKKLPIYRDFRVGDVKHSQADINKAKNLLNYHPTHKIDQAMDEVLDWYLKSFNDQLNLNTKR